MTNPLVARSLRHRIELERDVITRVNGAEVRTPEVFDSVWASVVYLSGNELWKAQQVNATVNVRVVIRYRTDVLASHRVIYDGKSLEIKGVIPDEERRDSVTLDCKGA